MDMRLFSVALIVTFVAVGASDARGRRLAQMTVTEASSSSSAAASGGGSSQAMANSTARDGGMSKSRAVADAQDGANVTATGQATAADGGMAEAIVNATGRGRAPARDAAGGLGFNTEAAAILAEELGGESGLSDAILEGDGLSIAEAVQAAFDERESVGAEAVLIVAEALAEAIGIDMIDGPSGDLIVGRTIAAGTSQGGEKAAKFGTIVSALLQSERCPRVRDALSEADRLATQAGKFIERAFIAAMNMDARIIRCLYRNCAGETADCCVEAARSEGSCNCDSEDSSAVCKYRLFWQIPKPIWACGFDSTDCEGPKCMCAQD